MSAFALGQGGFDHAAVVTLLDVYGNIALQQRGAETSSRELLERLGELGGVTAEPSAASRGRRSLATSHDNRYISRELKPLLARRTNPRPHRRPSAGPPSGGDDVANTTRRDLAEGAPVTRTRRRRPSGPLGE